MSVSGMLPYRPLLMFMRDHKFTGANKGSHTGMHYPITGKYNIPDEKTDQFWEIYQKSWEATMKSIDPETQKSIRFSIGLTEIPCENATPILIDIDIKQTNSERLYKKQDIINIVNLFIQSIKHFVETDTTTDFTAHVFEKPSTRPHNDNYKDGFHIMLMGIIVTKKIHIAIHKKVIEDLKLNNENMFGHLGNIDDIFDIASTRNNWMCYGTLKCGEMFSYTLTGKVHDNKFENHDSKVQINCRYFSIRGHTVTLKEKINEKQETLITVPSPNIKSTNKTDLVVNLVNMLSMTRCDNEREWMELGWCLYNIDIHLLNVWDTWSRKSTKYKEGECEKRWKNFKPNGGLTISSLYMWANSDNPAKYIEYIRSNTKNLLIEALSRSHYDVANVLYDKYKHLFTCSSIKRNTWYHFHQHRWNTMEEGYLLAQKMSSELANDVTLLSSWYSKKILECESASDEKELTSKHADCIKLMYLLKDNSFKTKVMKECATMFYDKHFMNMLDSKEHLICFNNGVYDIAKFEFRDGRPEDYISFCTSTNYVIYDQNDSAVLRLHNFLNTILPCKEVKIYVMKLLASCLEGTTRDQKVHIWTGSGANGKSTLIDLFESCLGDYCCKLPITLLTKKRNASNSASPEVQNAKGKRFASMQEPDEGDKINVGLMKELSGNDTIYSRGLYSSPVEFKPQFKMLLTCNQLPDIAANDDGTWRRVRVVEFGQKFVDIPVNENEHKIDPDMYTKLKESKDCFMFLLINYLTDYRKDGLHEPQSVLRHTNLFKYKSDSMIQYFNENIESSNEPNDKIPCLKFYHHFKSWYRDTNNTIAPNLKEFKEYIDNKLKYSKNSKGVYTGIRYIHNEEDDDNEF